MRIAIVLSLSLFAASAAGAAEPLLNGAWRAFDTGDFPTFAPNSIVAGDMNGDGIADAVAGREMFSGPGVTVLIGNGDGTFAPPVVYSLSSNEDVGAVALLDFDLDGDLDVLATIPGAFSDGATLAAWRNGGSGTLSQPPTRFATGTGPVGLAVGDFTGDALPDVVTADNGWFGSGTTVSLLAHNGLGGASAGFRAPVAFEVGAGPYFVEAGDVDGDGDLDLAVGRPQPSGNAILTNDGTGNFALPTYYEAAPGSYSQSAGVALADLDRDGDVDLVAGGAQNGSLVYGMVTVRRNRGDGTFGPAVEYRMPEWTYTPRTIRTGDVTGDGVADVIVTVPSGRAVDGFCLFRADGTGGLEAAEYHRASKWTYDAVAVDLNANGWRDVLTVANDASVVTVHDNSGGGVFPSLEGFAVGTLTEFMDAGDIDRDGDVDIVTCDTDVRILRNRGDGTFAPVESFDPTIDPGEALLRDLNGDGFLDLLLGPDPDAPPYHFATAINRGDGTFAPATVTPVGASQGGNIGAFDLDGNGSLDVVLTDPGPFDLVYLFENSGDGSNFVPRTPLPLSKPFRLAGADIDHDGHADLVTMSSFGIVVLPGNGDFTFREMIPTGEYAFHFALTDFDRDGNEDVALLLPQDSFGTVFVATMRGYGDGAFRFPIERSGPNGREGAFRISFDIDCADVDADGIPDVLLTNNAPGDVSVFRGAADGALARQDRYGVGYSCLFSVAADFDLDGAVDVASLNALPPGGFGNEVVVLRGTGVGGAGPRLEQTPLVRGEEATFAVSGARSGERVLYLATLRGTGAGPCVPQLGGLCIDLVSPVKLIGKARADASGVARLALSIPPGAPLRAVSTQAVIPRGADSVKSNAVTDVIR